MESVFNDVLQDGGFKPALPVVDKRHSYAEILVHRRSFAHIGVIELTAEAAEEHHWKFKTLGLVNGHDPYSVISFGNHLHLPHRNLFFFHRIYVTHKTVKRAVLGLAVSRGSVHKHSKIGLTAASCRHGAHCDIKAGRKHQLPQQVF